MSISNRINKRKKAQKNLVDLVHNPSQVLVIHYSCESFYDIPEGKTPRITSIATRYFSTAQTKTFSIHKVAELKKVPLDEIEQHYDMLEKEMLREFYKFVKSHTNYYWIHWNMRDINYGFEAISHRFSVLGGNPESISDTYKIDLARYLVDLYGLKYIGHPRLEKLLVKNGITKKDFLVGAEEAEAFKNKEYVRLHQSTLRKVDVLQTIAERTADGSLKTNAKLTEIYGWSPQGLYELIKENWLFGLIWTGVTLVLGGLVGAIFSNILGQG